MATQSSLSDVLNADVVIYADGASSGNPGKAGWGTILALPKQNFVEEFGGGTRLATNNQMELHAVIEGLHAARDQNGKCVVLTDSVYVIKGISAWIWGWMRNGWKTSAGEPVSNEDQWKELFRLTSARKKNSAQGEVRWMYVRGHSGIAGNERVDEIAVAHSKAQSITHYRGPWVGYPVGLFDLPETIGALPDSALSGVRKEKPKALGYLSFVNGVLEEHVTWRECEARVKGRPAAKFKKFTNSEERSAILKEWKVASSAPSKG
jgi:ribonuclease HI